MRMEERVARFASLHESHPVQKETNYRSPCFVQFFYLFYQVPRNVLRFRVQRQALESTRVSDYRAD
jgi:hypothetical protein